MAAPDQVGTARVVSSDSESLILVDEHDNELGLMSKGECHDGDGILHRAFSVFLFDPDGRLLIQQRAAEKRLWPLYWANSCCSHPRAGENLTIATQRRMHEELGLSAELGFIYKFRYQARFRDLGSEHELCSVFVGRTHANNLNPNPSELADWRFSSPEDIDQMMTDPTAKVAPWFRMEWASLRGEHRQRVNQVLSGHFD